MIGTIIARRAIAGAFEALNRHDLPAFMSSWRDDGTFTYPGDTPASGTFVGKAVVEDWFRRFFEQFLAIRFDVRDICAKNIFAFTGTNVIAVQWNLQLTNRDGRAVENSGVTVITIEGGKVVMVKDYFFDTGTNFKLSWRAA